MDTAAALEAIKQVKYAYFRTLDLKEFDALGRLLTEDATSSYEDGKTVLEGREAIVRWLSSVLGDPGIVTEHHGHHPEITFTSDTEAEGTWYLQDRVIVPAADLEIAGTAFYADRYRLHRRRLAHQPHRLPARLRGAPHPHDARGAQLHVPLRRRPEPSGPLGRAEGEARVEQRRRRQRLLDRLDEVGLELDVEGLHVLGDLLGPARPDDGAAHVLVPQHPGQRHRGRRVARPAAQRRRRPAPARAPRRAAASSSPRPRAPWPACPAGARSLPGRYLPVSTPWASGDHTIWPTPSFSHSGTTSASITRQISEYWGWLEIDAVEAHLVGQPQRVGDLLGRPLRHADVVHLALAHQVVEGAQGLLQRRGEVVAVGLEQVHVVGLQPARAMPPATP